MSSMGSGGLQAAGLYPIYAVHDDDTIRVYQAFGNTIADEAVRLGRFGAAFSRSRMTWIKPSFLWMMFRCGWATKPGQERVLAIDLARAGFDIITEQAVLSTFSAGLYGDEAHWRERLANTEARCQWDPDHAINGQPLPTRTIQLGIRDSLSASYVDEWIIHLDDITSMVTELRRQIEAKEDIESLLPVETVYTPVWGAGLS